jgi:hypothetical protein
MDNENNVGSKLGKAMATVIAVCLMALIIALTAKLIIWIF